MQAAPADGFPSTARSSSTQLHLLEPHLRLLFREGGSFLTQRVQAKGSLMISTIGRPSLSIFWPCRTLAMTCSGVCLRAMIRELPPASILRHDTHANTGLPPRNPTKRGSHRHGRERLNRANGCALSPAITTVNITNQPLASITYPTKRLPYIRDVPHVARN